MLHVYHRDSVSFSPTRPYCRFAAQGMSLQGNKRSVANQPAPQLPALRASAGCPPDKYRYTINPVEGPQMGNLG
jgi:hypothetical protein